MKSIVENTAEKDDALYKIVASEMLFFKYNAKGNILYGSMKAFWDLLIKLRCVESQLKPIVSPSNSTTSMTYGFILIKP